MKSKKLAKRTGIIAILGGLFIYYASSQRWRFEFTNLNPRFIENTGWGGLVILTSFLFMGLSILGMAHYSEDPRVNKINHKLLFSASLSVRSGYSPGHRIRCLLPGGFEKF